MFDHGFRKYEIIKLLNDIKKRIKQIEENVPIQIDNAINQLLDGAPQALDTLKELADALGNNPDFLTELNNRIDSINTKKDWNQNDEDADDYIENRTHYLEEGKYIFYKPNATSFNSSDRISLDDALDILNGIDNTYLTRSVIVRNISTSYSTHHKEKCQLIVTDGYLYLNTQYNNSNNDYIDFYNLNDVANRIKSINEEVTYNDIKTLLNNNSMTFNGNTNYFEKSDDVYHKLNINYVPSGLDLLIESGLIVDVTNLQENTLISNELVSKISRAIAILHNGALYNRIPSSIFIDYINNNGFNFNYDETDGFGGIMNIVDVFGYIQYNGNNLQGQMDGINLSGFSFYVFIDTSSGYIMNIFEV